MLVLGQFPSWRDAAGVALLISGIALHRQPTGKGD
jgi:drug/metabolite transporter (DMT)-like permease